jgi:hypothetical protein
VQAIQLSSLTIGLIVKTELIGIFENVWAKVGTSVPVPLRHSVGNLMYHLSNAPRGTIQPIVSVEERDISAAGPVQAQITSPRQAAIVLAELIRTERHGLFGSRSLVVL